MSFDIIQLQGITSCTVYPNGQIEDCRLNQKNVISTLYGDLIPHCSSPGIRDKELKSVSFYESGAVRSIALEVQTDILTPLGAFPAELLTFYENGTLDSIFPLNGQIGFGWSEKEEKALAQTVTFDFPFGSFAAKPIGLRFYASGSLRSLILWPGEVINLCTPIGEIPVRIGFKLYENGALESVEPAFPAAVSTPIGSVSAFDVTALGIDADFNSLCFDKEGNLVHLVTSGDIVVKNRTAGERVMFSSRTKPGMTDDVPVKVPIHISFQNTAVIIDDGVKIKNFEISDYDFLVLSDFSTKGTDCVGDCNECSGCG